MTKITQIQNARWYQEFNLGTGKKGTSGKTGDI